MTPLWLTTRNNLSNLFFVGVKWGDNDKLNDFKKGNYWQIGWDKTDKKKGAIQAWKNIKEIEPGDFLAFHGLGGKYDLVIYQVSKVLEVDEDKGVLKLENLSGSSVVYRGKAPQMSGGWFGTLLPVTGKAVDSIFGKYIQDGEMNETLAEQKENMNVSLNTILYGPPGTGKTFNTMAYAVSICEEKDVSEIKKEMQDDYGSVKKRYDALKDAGRIEFVTFHQSYGYEDFIEGIRPDLDNTTGELKYKLEVGSFKSFCDKVFGNFEEAWENLCDKLDDEEREYLEIPYISDETKTFPIEWNASHNGLKAKGAHRFFNKKQLENVYKKEPGVKKRGHDNYRKAIVKFMQKECGLKEYNGNEKSETVNNARVFIIDEINRGNISKIFGELITLIEPSKRIGAVEEMYAKLPCSGDEFGVPNNVYILGTMNTADRSIAMMDTALRRRFNFVEMMPDTGDSSPLKGKVIGDIDICEMLKTINKRIEYLYDREHTIGHAFFIGINDFAGLASVFKNKVIPLLQEYFYDDYEKIRLVLGDDGKSKEHQFVTKDAPEQNLFKGRDIDDGNDDEKYIYEINQNAFELPDSYKGII